MRCPVCGFHKPTAETQTAENRADRTRILRVRYCPACLEAFVTSEAAIDEAKAGVCIYGAKVVSTQRYDTSTKRLRRMPDGSMISTMEEIIERQQERYRAPGDVVRFNKLFLE